jgi:hypothetical protein
MKRVAHISDSYIVNVSLKSDDAELSENQMLEAEALASGYTYRPQPQVVKSWPNVEAFLSEFTMDEMAQIGLSTDPTIAALRFLLSGWFSQVLSDDPRVVQGLTMLVNLDIISDERRTQILS